MISVYSNLITLADNLKALCGHILIKHLSWRNWNTAACSDTTAKTQQNITYYHKIYLQTMFDTGALSKLCVCDTGVQLSAWSQWSHIYNTRDTNYKRLYNKMMWWWVLMFFFLSFTSFIMSVWAVYLWAVEAGDRPSPGNSGTERPSSSWGRCSSTPAGWHIQRWMSAEQAERTAAR